VVRGAGGSWPVRRDVCGAGGSLREHRRCSPASVAIAQFTRTGKSAVVDAETGVMPFVVMVGALVPARRPVAPPPVGHTSIGDYLFASGLPVRPPPRGAGPRNRRVGQCAAYGSSSPRARARLPRRCALYR
jgi:hypothetical protein